MVLKTVFTFNLKRAHMIYRLTQAWAKEHHCPASTQAFLDALVERAYDEYQWEQIHGKTRQA